MRPKTRVKYAATLLLLFLLGAAGPACAQCVSGPVLHELSFTAEATADLDEAVFWDPAPEMFLRVLVEGIPVCQVDGDEGWRFAGRCSFSIDEPYDPVEIELMLMDEDQPLDDYTVDISATPAKTFKFSFDPQCGVVSQVNEGDLPACPAGNKLPTCRGLVTTTGSEGTVTFSLAPAADVPIVPNSLSISRLETIQVVPNATRLVTDRPTVVRMNIGNSHPTVQNAVVTVTVRDLAGNVFVDARDVLVPGCGSVQKFTMFPPGWAGGSSEAGFRPQSGPLNLLSIEAELAPGPDCDGVEPPCQGDVDCRVLDGKTWERGFQLVDARPLSVLYQPFLRIPLDGCFQDQDLELPALAAADAAPLFEDLYPINVYRGESQAVRSIWPLPMGEPLIDLANQLDPRPGLLMMELSAAIAGLDRLVLMTNPGGLSCHWATLNAASAPGAAAGIFSRVALAEGRRGPVRPAEIYVHEVTHTFGGSDAACPISDNLFGGILCEDEYNFPADRTVAPGNGVASRGFQVLRWQLGESSGTRDMDGRACVMGSSSIGTPDAWIDGNDYETLLDQLTDTSPEEPSLFVRMRLTAGWGGTFLREDVSRLTTRPTARFDALTGRLPTAYSTTMRVLRADDSVVGTVSFTAEAVDADGDGTTESYGGAHTDEAFAFLDVPKTIPLPPDAQRIELVRRSPGPSGAIETVTDVLLLDSPPITVEWLEPLSSFFARAMERYTFRWRIAPFAKGGGETAIPTRSYLFLSEDDGQTWFPLASFLPGESFEWQAERDGRYLVRVFTTSGFETADLSGEQDPDFDGCGLSRDPQPKIPDQDGADDDGVAQVCDVCPFDYDPLQGDDDEDGPGNTCDNCPTVANTDQSNLDQDARGDACDCAPSDPTTWAVPGAVTGLRVNRSAEGNDYVALSWVPLANQAGTGTVYDILSGDVALLSTANPFGQLQCLGVDVTGPDATGFQPAPQPGQAFWYLIRGQSACGQGPYGTGSPGEAPGRDDGISGGVGQCA